MTAMVLLSEWMKSQVEFWMPTRFEGYDVSSFGKVRSFWRRGAPKRLDEWHFVGGSYDSYGYLFTEFRRAAKDGPRRRCWVHRLVVEAFIPNWNQLPEINHKTGLKSDNRLDNLEWTDKSSNIRHSVQIGLRDHLPKGERHAHAVVTESDVREIRRRVAAGETMPQVAKDYRITKSGVKHIVARRCWKHVE